jgi:hypothetical protein
MYYYIIEKMPYISDRIFSKLYENDYLLKLNSIKDDKNSELKEGDFPTYDIIHDNITYEIKTCRYAIKTHNICIEFECNSRPSGISKTTSDYYIYYVVNKDNKNKLYEYYYKIPTTTIKELIERKEYKKIQNGGDGFKSKFYLFSDILFEKFKII